MILEGDEVVGTMVLGGVEVKRRIKGKTEPLRTYKSEEERLQALEDVFGSELTQERGGSWGVGLS